MEAFSESKKGLMAKLSPNVRRAWNHRESGMRLKARIIFDYELLYLEKGQLTLRIDHTIHNILPGDIVLFKPGKEHEFIESVGECWMPHIHFDALYADNHEEVPISYKSLSECSEQEKGWIREDVLGSVLQIPDVIRVDNHGEILKTLQQLIYAYERRDLAFYILQKSLVLKLIYLIAKGLEAYELTRSRVHHKSLDAAATLIMERFDQAILLEELSKTATLSVYHFSRLFKQKYGLTPHQFQMRYRIEKAKHLLIYTPLSITTIAEKVGYGSVFAFSKAFKQIESISPRKFIQAFTGLNDL
ncbi:helix-turn-helix transcriptional regulator [Paenibacillus sp. FJAT-27812]|uniref:helix-turn-helix transcriptional regulator n=1 Tax=Paenibacillus sp. FJAT-27812 TaxID=1684143 RepID=UPI0006A7C1A9|nr:helix-turn-helix domain-containing protein [Paenibacillus sp. FJAT-27812]